MPIKLKESKKDFEVYVNGKLRKRYVDWDFTEAVYIDKVEDIRLAVELLDFKLFKFSGIQTTTMYSGPKISTIFIVSDDDWRHGSLHIV